MDDAHSFAISDRWSEDVLKRGYTIVPNVLISGRSQLRLTPTEIYVFVALDSFRWDNWHNPFPSLMTLSRLTGLHKQTIYRSLKKLEQVGLLYKEHRYNSSTVYDLSVANDALSSIL